MKPTKLIATYCRVSTSTQEEQETIKTQTATLKEYADKQGYTIVKAYDDDGWSGDVLARPALDQLRQDAQEKMWDAVLIYDPDRLARRYSYQELVMDELKEAGREVIFVTVTAPKNSEDKILHGVRGLFAEYERAKITERFRLGKLRKVKDGHVLVSEAPYGYTYIPRADKTHGYFEINEEEAKVVRMMFTWVADEGLTLRAVVRRLQDKAIKPRKSKRGVWNTSTLSHLLKNKAFIGEAHWGSSYAVVPENPFNKEKYRKMKKTSRRAKPENEWITIPVPAIIDKELFERARAQIEANFALCDRNKKNQYLLGGKIWCTCGRRRCGEGPQHGKHLYYRCNDRVASFPLPPSCHLKGINARIADDLVWKKIAQLMSSPELMHNQVERWLNSRQSKGIASVGDIEAITKEIESQKEKEDRYNKAYGSGLLSIQQLKEYTLPIRERISVLENERVKVEQQRLELDEHIIPTKKEVKAFAQEATKVLSNLSFTPKRAIVMNIVDKVIGTKEHLEVKGFIPVTETHVKSFTIYRHRRSSKCGQIHTLQRPY